MAPLGVERFDFVGELAKPGGYFSRLLVSSERSLDEDRAPGMSMRRKTASGFAQYRLMAYMTPEAI
jgi:hypothetical protein